MPPKMKRSIRKADPSLLPEENSRNYSVTPQQSKPLNNYRTMNNASARKPTDQNMLLELDRAINENGSLSNATLMILKELINRNQPA
jgi:hypothetical protein